MQVKYYPSRDNNNTPIRLFAVAVLLPDNYDSTKKWPWMMSVHGIGERSDGMEAHLKNLVEGIDFDKNGTIDWVFAMDSMKKAVDQYGIVIAVPTYKNFFEPSDVNYIHNFMVTTFNVENKFLFEGFSLGGGAVLKYITSSLINAQNVAYAVPVAPTRELNQLGYIAYSKLPVHVFVNDQDDNAHTNLSVTKAIVSTINAGGTPLPAVYTAFRQSGHGGHGEAVGINPPKAPGGQGLIDAAENIFQVYLDILKNGPRQMKMGTISTPAPPPTPTTSTVTIKTRFEIAGSIIKLIGSESAGYKDGLEGTWQFVSGPAGATSQLVFPTGSSYINAQGKLPVPGIYVFKFTLKGQSATVTVEYVGEKTVKAFNIDTVVFSDGTSEKATATLSSGAWKIKTESGKIYNA